MRKSLMVGALITFRCFADGPSPDLAACRDPLRATAPAAAALAAPNFRPALPSGALLLDKGPDFIRYRSRMGEDRVMFRVSAAYVWQHPTNGINNTDVAQAALTPGKKVIVIEGRHRAVGAAYGDVIPPGLGGIAPGWLDYSIIRAGVLDEDLTLPLSKARHIAPPKPNSP